MQTTAERIARCSAERIVSGELAPGVRLRQDRVAEEFESSHVPAREAFQLLRAQGLLISEPRRGMRVAPLDHASMQEIVEIRASLEVLALTHAAPKLNAACLDKIERALLAGEQAQSITEWEQANRAFHRELVAPGQCPVCLPCSKSFNSPIPGLSFPRPAPSVGSLARAMLIVRLSTL